MKIKTRLYLESFIFVCIISLILIRIIQASRLINSSVERIKIISSIITDVDRFDNVLVEHLLYRDDPQYHFVREQRIEHQQHQIQDSFEKTLKEAKKVFPKSAVNFLESYEKRYRKVRQLFEQIDQDHAEREPLKKHSSSDAIKSSKDKEERSQARLVIHLQEMVSEAQKFAFTELNKITDIKKKVDIGVTIFSIFFVGLAGGFIVSIVRRIIHPLDQFKKGAQTIGKGNLDYRINMSRKDEIGSLANAFDQMTSQVQEFMAQLKHSNEKLKGVQMGLEISHEKVKLKNNELETLLYIISHDLKEPLRGIEYFSSKILNTCPQDINEDIKDSLTRVINATTRMSLLLNEILTFSRVRNLKTPHEDLNCKVIIEVILSRLESKIEETNAKITVSQELPVIRADKLWATQAIYNLVANALKFTKDGESPEVDIRGYRDDDLQQTGVVVCDRGIGIAEEHHERIFQLFQRAVGRKIEGTGAGLAIVREIAVRHGGNVWVQSREGGGSEFTITFNEERTNE